MEGWIQNKPYLPIPVPSFIPFSPKTSKARLPQVNWIHKLLAIEEVRWKGRKIYSSGKHYPCFKFQPCHSLSLSWVRHFEFLHLNFLICKIEGSIVATSQLCYDHLR